MPNERFSRETKEALRRLIERDRQALSQQLGPSGGEEMGAIRQVRLAKTGTNSLCASYPAVGSTKFPIIMGELTWDDQTCDEEELTWTAYDSEYDRIAVDPEGIYHSNGEYVLVYLSHGQWYIASGGSGGDCNTVMFEVISADADSRSALCRIIGLPHGCGLSDIPDIEQGFLDIITVCDAIGCYFNEPAGDLVGRQGWAKYMTPIGANVCQPDPNYLVSMWTVFSICCAVPTCDIAGV